MNQKTWDEIQTLFEAGLLLDEVARQRLLLEHCADKPELSAEVEQLWENCDEEDPVFSFEELPELTRNFFLSTGGNFSGIPKVINSYEILETIAQGGMGTVYKARQEKPIERIVALKILPPEYKGGEYLQRFQAEQRALGLMAHPNVAAVFDAGVTMDERPYFAMEFLPSTTITGYCDENRLSIRDRLGLFLQICEGVRHAHQKGIIHRDLKPANILVSEVDGRPVPKIIDFGIAKFLDQTLLAAPLKTRAGAVIGTPAYMSPEQAEGSEHQVDTRSDVYALGVLLYQLLTGVTPFKMEDGPVDSFAQVRRLLREGAVEKPSARIRADPDAFSHAAAERQTDPESLARRLQGELDWLIGKAMQREAEMRYQSCSEMAEDVRRFLAGLPLLAAPPGNLYNLKTFVRRHKRAVLVAGVIAFLLVAGLTATSMALVRALRAEDEARTALATVQAVNDFSVSIFEEVGPYRSGHEVTGEEILKIAAKRIGDQYAERPEIEAATRLVLGRSFRGLGLTEEAHEQLLESVNLRRGLFGEQHPSTLEAKSALAYVHYREGDYARAEQLYQECYDGFRALSGERDRRTLVAAGGLAFVWAKTNRKEDSAALFKKTLAAQREQLGPEDPQTLVTQNNYANLLSNLGRFQEAENLHRQTLASNLEIWGQADVPAVSDSMHNLAKSLQDQGRFEEAAEQYREALSLRREIFGRNHLKSIMTLSNLAGTLTQMGRIEEALDLLRNGVDLEEIDPERANSQELLLFHIFGNTFMKAGDSEEAAKYLELAYQGRRTTFGETHEKTLITRATQAENLQKMGELERAESIFREVFKISGATAGADDEKTLVYKGLLGKCLADQGGVAEGRRLLQESVHGLKATGSQYVSDIESLLNEVEGKHRVN